MSNGGEHELKRLLAQVYDDPAVAEEAVPGRVRTALEALARSVDLHRRELDAVRNEVARLEELADRDPLLGIFNRRAFERELARASAYTARYKVPASLIFIDLNKFKWINDVYGHKAGDTVLRHVASVIASNIRTSDILGRLGGDEFAVILVQADQQAALAKAERLEAIIATTPIDIDGTTVLLTASAGAVEISGEADLAAEMERADALMYARKSSYHAADTR